MNIEIVEFFPISIDQAKETLSGTLKIKLVDFGINILGIFVTKKKNAWFFSLPGRTALDRETGQEIRFPFVAFEDREKHKELIAEIRNKGRIFIESKFSDSNSLILHQNEGIKTEDSKTFKTSDTAPAVKETTSISKPEINQAIASKKWTDPPKRIQTAKHSLKRKG